MGGCFSSVVDSSSSSASTAKVISASGDLLEFPIPFSVSQLLQSMAAMDDSSNNSSIPSSSSNSLISSLFVCNSDCLYYDDFIPALDLDDFLQPNQIYFLLPKTKLQFRLSASDMAALAVKASLALQKFNNASSSSSSIIRGAGAGARRHKYNKKARISPVVLLHDHNNQLLVKVNNNAAESTISKSSKNLISSSNSKMMMRASSLSSPPDPPPVVISRSGSIRKLHRYSSKRAKMAVRSFRLRLTTIYEGSAVL